MCRGVPAAPGTDRKSTRLNSSHSQISYAVFCLKKKTRQPTVRIDPFAEGLAPHPGQLPLAQLARRRNGPSHPLLQVVLPVELRPQLPVAHCAHRGMMGGEGAAAA